MVMKRWTPEEISKLKDMARKYPASKIADELGRGSPRRQSQSTSTQAVIKD